MPLTSEYRENDKQLIIRISGKFDYTLHSALRETYHDLPEGINYVIDLDKTEYVDSSALGMLLLLRDHAGRDRSSVSIVNCRASVKRIFTLAQFDKLFKIN